MDQNGRPIRAIIKAGTTADCCQAESLRPGIQTQYLLTDKGYDSQAILQTTDDWSDRDKHGSSILTAEERWWPIAPGLILPINDA